MSKPRGNSFHRWSWLNQWYRWIKRPGSERSRSEGAAQKPPQTLSSSFQCWKVSPALPPCSAQVVGGNTWIGNYSSEDKGKTLSCSWSISPTPSSFTSGAANEWILHQSLNRHRARPGCHPSKALTPLTPSPALSPHRTLWFSWIQPGATPPPCRSRKSQLCPGGFPVMSAGLCAAKRNLWCTL